LPAPFLLERVSIIYVLQRLSPALQLKKGDRLIQHHFQNLINARPTQAAGAESDGFDLGLQYTPFETRFTKVDDVFARLSSDPRVIKEVKAKG
jgi:hypothetical protein